MSECEIDKERERVSKRCVRACVRKQKRFNKYLCLGVNVRGCVYRVSVIE